MKTETKRLVTIAAFWLSLLMGVLFFFLPRHPNTGIVPILLPGEKEKVIVDPIHHTITTITDKGTKTTTLPDHPSSVTLKDNGDVIVTAKQFGREIRPFVGIGYAQEAKFYLGTDLFFWKKLDLGTAISLNQGVKLVGLVSMNLYSNTRVSIGVDNKGAINGAFTLRM